MTERQMRQKVCEVATKWIGKKEGNGTHKSIIDIYNSQKKLPRGYRLKYTDAWCAGYVSAVMITAGVTAVAPTECGCGEMIKRYQSLGRWIEDDNYVPQCGDVIMYDWQDSGNGDNTGWPDHTGIVTAVVASKITVTEGNYNDAVGQRTIAVGARYIRGYCVPDYASIATPDASAYDIMHAAGIINVPETANITAGTLADVLHRLHII